MSALTIFLLCSGCFCFGFMACGMMTVAARADDASTKEDQDDE